MPPAAGKGVTPFPDPSRMGPREYGVPPNSSLTSKNFPGVRGDDPPGRSRAAPWPPEALFYRGRVAWRRS
jgi:hypothetical protein